MPDESTPPSDLETLGRYYHQVDRKRGFRTGGIPLHPVLTFPAVLLFSSLLGGFPLLLMNEPGLGDILTLLVLPLFLVLILTISFNWSHVKVDEGGVHLTRGAFAFLNKTIPLQEVTGIQVSNRRGRRGIHFYEISLQTTRSPVVLLITSDQVMANNLSQYWARRVGLFR